MHNQDCLPVCLKIPLRPIRAFQPLGAQPQLVIYVTLLCSVVDGQGQIINSRTFAVSPLRCQVKSKGNGLKYSWKQSTKSRVQFDNAVEAIFISQGGVLPPLAAARRWDAFLQLPWVYKKTQQGNISQSPPFGCSPVLM